MYSSKKILGAFQYLSGLLDRNLLSVQVVAFSEPVKLGSVGGFNFYSCDAGSSPCGASVSVPAQSIATENATLVDGNKVP